MTLELLCHDLFVLIVLVMASLVLASTRSVNCVRISSIFVSCSGATILLATDVSNESADCWYLLKKLKSIKVLSYRNDS